MKPFRDLLPQGVRDYLAQSKHSPLWAKAAVSERGYAIEQDPILEINLDKSAVEHFESSVNLSRPSFSSEADLDAMAQVMGTDRIEVYGMTRGSAYHFNPQGDRFKTLSQVVGSFYLEGNPGDDERVDGLQIQRTHIHRVGPAFNISLMFEGDRGGGYFLIPKKPSESFQQRSVQSSLVISKDAGFYERARDNEIRKHTEQISYQR